MKKSIFKPYTNKTSIAKRYSRMTQGGVSEVYANRIGWWERDVSLNERSVDDIQVTIDHTTDRKPHLVADEYYGRSDLFWIILQYNNIIDINEEFRVGTIIQIPTQKRVYYSLTLKTPITDTLYE